MSDTPTRRPPWTGSDHLMYLDPEKPGWWSLLHGEGDRSMRVVAWIGTLVLTFLIAFAILVVS